MIEGAPEGKSSETQRSVAALAAVWARFRDATLQRVTVMEDATLALLEGRLTDDLRRAAEREAHKVAGSAGTFGFPLGSKIAAQLEQSFRATDLQAVDAVQLSESLISLRDHLEGTPQYARSAAAGAPEMISGNSRPMALIVCSESETLARAQQEIEARGISGTTAADLGVARQLLRDHSFAAALFYVDDSTKADSVELVRELATALPAVAALVVGPENFRMRIDVARAGGHSYLVSGTSPSIVAEHVRALITPNTSTRSVLVADDDPSIIEALRILLKPLAVALTSVDDPAEFWDAMERADPELVIIDVDMPEISGFELARTVRMSPRWASVPVLVLSSRTDTETIQQAFASGADDYVAKPIVTAELLMRVKNRLERSGMDKQAADTDRLTGIASRRSAEESIKRIISNGDSQNPASIAKIDIDRIGAINDRHGPATGDEIIRSVAQYCLAEFGKGAVGRWSGDQFVVALSNADKNALGARVEAVLKQFSREFFRDSEKRQLAASFSAGVAQFPGDGASSGEILKAADSALYAAKQGGRSRVHVADAVSGSTRDSVDVVLVDDDVALSQLLQHALETAGSSVRSFSDGESAASELGGEFPALTAGVIILDVDLPGMNGHDLLRRLASDGIPSRSSVIMLTGRRGEADILAALSLGAIDHVVKPFSVPVLLRKIESALSARRK